MCIRDRALIARALGANQFVVEDLHITFSSNGTQPAPRIVSEQLKLDFDDSGGVTVRIEATGEGVIIKKMSA